ncbi:hypothetical protein ACH5RR_036176 [Cinchona calisaya]|uniref:VQ domain-containing protein n=1 Tax=Cinchona calisaya TaxID=153742 RepID=A0ABD2Y5N2_9GENT
MKNPVNSFQEEPRTVMIINGPRPSPLRINKDSHVIQKQQNATRLMKNQQQQPPRQPPPVIIYTHSPKIIHTKPKDFMALVQKLTGFTPSDDDDKTTSFDQEKKYSDNTLINLEDYNNDEYPSSVTSDGDEMYDGRDHMNTGLNPYLTDIPLFTPTSNNLFSSPHPNVVGSPSPWFLEFIKGLPEC